MEITIKYKTLCNLLWTNFSNVNTRSEKVNKMMSLIIHTYGLSVDDGVGKKLESFLKTYERKIRECNNSVLKFKNKNEIWLNMGISTEIQKRNKGRPSKKYDDVQSRTKKAKQEDMANFYSGNQIKDSFKLVLEKTQPKEAVNIVDVLPTASPKRLRRMVESIPTPKSNTYFTEEDALALILNLGLSRNKYKILRNALKTKSWGLLPSTSSLLKRKMEILPSPVIVDNKSAIVGLSDLLHNTASRIIANFDEEDLDICNNTELILIYKWGCDGSSGFSEYRQASESEIDFSTVLMASLVPLRLRLYNEMPTASAKSVRDIWINKTPGSKFLCRPIRFEYNKENRETTQNLVDSIKREISNMAPIDIHVSGRVITVSFKSYLTMIDGKVAYAITDTKSYWRCNICEKIGFDLNDITNTISNNEDALKLGISPLHARIRFMEYTLHLAYDNKYRSVPGHQNVAVKNNSDLKNMRSDEKKRIQKEFMEHGLIIDKPQYCYGSSNDGNTARRFFEDPETTSLITGIDYELLKSFKIILATINSKKEINKDKFEKYANKTLLLINKLYPWRPITPTVHRVLVHAKEIIEHSILPLGELTEEAQEANNRDVKQFRLFNTRKCSKISQNSDLMHHLLLSSDPVLHDIRIKWLPKLSLEIEKDDPEAMEIKYLLSPDTSDYFVENPSKCK